MTTEPVIIPPANFTEADIVDWMDGRETIVYQSPR